MAIKAVLPSVKLLKGYDIRREASDQFASWVSEELGIEGKAVETAREAVEDSDIVVTVTVADEPIVKDAWLKKGSLFAHVGSYQEEEEEVIYHSDKIVVDLWEEVLHRGTPLLAKLYKAGRIKSEKIYANIGEIIRGKKSGRTNKSERIFFSPLGLGSEDVAVGTLVYREAKRRGLGVPLKLWDNPAIV
jgi:ornithine cyclodeaminase